MPRYIDLMYKERIGELCREGKTVYYAFLDQGSYIESDDRAHLCRALIRWANRDRTGDYLDDFFGY
jgi:hypothetical protein